MAANNQSRGAAKAKPHESAISICRSTGYKATENAMQSKTRSNHKGTDKHNRWEGQGSGTGGNVKGYGS